MPRLSVNINDETAEAIREAKVRRDANATTTVHRAVSLYHFLVEAQKRGDRIQLVDGHGVTRVVIL